MLPRRSAGARAPCVGASPLIFPGPVPPALRASLPPVPTSSGRRCQDCAAFLTSSPKRGLWDLLCCSPLLEGLERSCRMVLPEQGAPQLTLLIPGSGAKRQAQGFHRGLCPGEGTVSAQLPSLLFPCSSPGDFCSTGSGAGPRWRPATGLGTRPRSALHFVMFLRQPLLTLNPRWGVPSAPFPSCAELASAGAPGAGCDGSGLKCKGRPARGC